ncbi:MAG: cytidine deaminase [Frankiaceae bacterium]|nr:cytidine deaminase [Frankiaceae bacterium]
MADLDHEDLKLVTLAGRALQRAHAPHTQQPEGAAVRDTDGRTYAAGTVENIDPALTTSALRGAVAAAASSGARSFEAAVVVVRDARTFDEASVRHVRPADLAVLREFGAGVPVLLAGPDGVVHETVTT